MFTETYERKLRGNSLVLSECEDNISPNEFEERMITENEIKGLLSCHLVNRDEIRKFSYDITSKQSLENMFEERELKEKDLKRIISGLINVQSSLEEYLLSEENLVLSPRFLYIDPETRIPSFVFYPYYKREIQKSLTELGTFLLERTDHNDDKAVKLVYGFYKNIVNEDYAFEKLLYINGETEERADEYKEEIDKDIHENKTFSCEEEKTYDKEPETLQI